jgi:ribonuclease T2
MRITPWWLALLCLLGLPAAAADCVAPTTLASTHYDVSPADERLACYRQSVNIPTDYFALVIAWSPGFCDGLRAHGPIPERHLFQCGPDAHFGWILHGLWGASRSPDFCLEESVSPPRRIHRDPRYCKGDLPKLAPATLLPYMCTQPGAALLQGEWEKHGACDFPTADAYFARAKQLFDAIAKPPSNLPREALLHWMAEHNPALAGRRLRYQAATGEVVVCYSTAFEPIDC